MLVIDRGVIFDVSQAPENCRSSAFTSVIRLSDGILIVAFRVGSGRDAPDGRLRIMSSRDEGVSWQALHPGTTAVVDGVEGNLYAGYFTEINPNRLLGVFVWVDRSNPELSFVNPETAGVLPMRNLLAESRDGGKTWSPFDSSISRHKKVVLAPGRLFRCRRECWRSRMRAGKNTTIGHRVIILPRCGSRLTVARPGLK